MRLSARYRLYLLGGLYLAPYCAMLAWCLQSAKPRSVITLVLTAALGSLLLAGVTRTWRRFFLAYFPFLLLTLAYTAYSLGYGITPGYMLSLVLVSATLEEMLGLLTIWPQKWLLLPLCAFVGTYLWLAWHLPQRAIFSGNAYIGARVILGLSIPALAYAAQSTPQLVDGMALNPAVGSLMFCAGQLPRARREIHGAGVHKSPFDASRNEKDEEVHVFVLGESARRGSWSVYGYERPTTPYLEKIRPEIILLEHAMSDANLTSMSVPIILTGIGPDQISSASPRGNLLDVAKEAGYATAWLVNQDLTVTTAIGVTADHLVIPPDPNMSFFGRHVADESLLPAYQRELASTGSSRFIAMHVMGSHWEYYQRYPTKFQRYGDTSHLNTVSLFSGNKRTEEALRDSYDNSVLYTDWFLQEVIERARQLKVPATVTFVPDHGESVAVLDGGAAGHGGPNYYASQFQIPAFIWVNEAYRAAHPEKVSALRSNAVKEIRSHDFFYTVADMMGITWPGKKLDRSFASAAFIPDTASKYIVGGVLTAIPEQGATLVSQR
jgi:glucan phosphoethanolaminetransferase (alkaline phosphatase superfamily)